ncbi:MAG: hypothetical protein GXO26_09380 [Crenarchaeota archaeon]|nr:hypothetical protein [Thermoproteota archaeon]
MKLIGNLTKKDNLWILQIPRPVLKVAELNGVKISSKVRVRIRIFENDGSSVETDAKVQTYGGDVCYLILPQQVVQSLKNKRGEVVFEVLD